MCKLKVSDYSKWNELLKRCHQVNLLQTWEYGEVKRIIEGWKPTRYIIMDDDEPLGLVQVLIKSLPLPLFGGVARINRGPLFFYDIHGRRDLNDIIEKTLQAIMLEIVEKGKCYLSIIPEIKEGEEFNRIFKRLGLKTLGTIPWSSTFIDLSLSEDRLLENLNSKWRNLLKKSEKMGLELEQTLSDEAVDFLMKQYQNMQQEKQFKGVSEDIIRELKRQITSDKNMQVFFARKNGVRVAGILIVGHGDNCTYLVGWNTSDGRQLQANYFLLWQAMISFKHFNYRWFDVGGISKDTTPNIAHFKSGLGGKDYTLVGEWETYKYGFIPKVIKFIRKYF